MARDAAPVFDEIIHSPNRLRICVLLSTVETMEFAALRADLGVADSVLSKHLDTLADAGYVTLTRPTGLGGRPRTWARLTTVGHHTLHGHLAALRQLTALATQTPPPEWREPAPNQTTSRPVPPR
ncbi:MAG: transcriptional regulator [Propionicimonas sp.]